MGNDLLKKYEFVYLLFAIIITIYNAIDNLFINYAIVIIMTILLIIYLLIMQLL